MNKFEKRRRYLLSMFFATLNHKELNNAFLNQILGDAFIEQLVWKDIIDPEKFYGEDTNQYLDFIERH